MSDKPGEMDICENCAGPRSASVVSVWCIGCLRNSAPEAKVAMGKCEGCDGYNGSMHDDDCRRCPKRRDILAENAKEIEELKAKLEDITRRTITACLSYCQGEIEFRKANAEFALCRSWAGTSCLSIGESFAVVLHKDVPKGKVYLLSEELLELAPEEVSHWIMEHPNGVAVVINVG